jgi:ketopantoate reductase
MLFGFPGGGGARIDHVVHYIDTEKPNGKRMSVTIGEIDGVVRERTRQVRQLFESANVPVTCVAEIESWLKYHTAFVNPLAGALLQAGDNYALAEDEDTILQYIHAVKEGGRVLKTLGYTRSYNPKLRLFYILPERLTMYILKNVFSSRSADVAMMMHVNAARDEMLELEKEFEVLKYQTVVSTPNLDGLNLNLV